MLTFVVSPIRQTIITADGQKMKVFPTLIKENGKYDLLQERTEFSNIEDIEILVFWWFWKLRLNLTPKIKKAIVKFLHVHHAKQDITFDCYAFANQFCGVPQHDKSLLRNFWDIQPCRRYLQIGDVLFFASQQEKCFHHAAIYIGRGLYISVYGAGGDLEVASLKDMKRDFGAKDVLIARPLLPVL